MSDDTNPSTGGVSPFEAIKHSDENGELWLFAQLLVPDGSDTNDD